MSFTSLSALVSETGGNSPSEKDDNELKDLEQLSSFSSDEEEPGVHSNDIIKTSLIKRRVSGARQVGTATSPAVDSTSHTPSSSTAVKQDSFHSASSASAKSIERDGLPSNQFAKGQDTLAIEAFTDDQNAESEGQY